MRKAGRVDVNWDGGKCQWRIRVKIGQQIIKRALGQVGRDASDGVLRSKAIATVNDEGYVAEPAQVEILRPDSATLQETMGNGLKESQMHSSTHWT